MPMKLHPQQEPAQRMLHEYWFQAGNRQEVTITRLMLANKINAEALGCFLGKVDILQRIIKNSMLASYMQLHKKKGDAACIVLP